MTQKALFRKVAVIVASLAVTAVLGAPTIAFADGLADTRGQPDTAELKMVQQAEEQDDEALGVEVIPDGEAFAGVDAQGSKDVFDTPGAQGPEDVLDAADVQEPEAALDVDVSGIDAVVAEDPNVGVVEDEGQELSGKHDDGLQEQATKPSANAPPADAPEVGKSAITPPAPASKSLALASNTGTGMPPESFSGECNIDWFVTSGEDTTFGLSGFSGVPSSYDVSEGWCLDHTAAEPSGWAEYVATLTGADSSAGKAYYSLYITPPDATDGYTRNELGLTGYQHVGATMTLDWSFGGRVHINKVSANPPATENNDCYSLAGAVYGVYADAACTDQVVSLITDADGATETEELLSSGTYYVKEVKASAGFMLDETVYTVTVADGGTATVTCFEVPAMDPATIVKVDADKVAAGSADVSEAQGQASMEGAHYTWQYYAGEYSTVEQAQGSGAPTRSWVFKTNANGVIRYTDSFFVSGDALYTNANGIYTLPLGTLVVFESKAPTGYILDSFKYLGQIYQPDGGKEAAFRWVNAGSADRVVADKVIRGGITVAKWDIDSDSREAQGDADLAATIEIVNASVHDVFVEGRRYAPGQVVKTATLSKDGLWTSTADLLPYGKYVIREKDAPAGYTSSGITEREILITEDGEIVSMDNANVALKNKVIEGGLKLAKWDSDLGCAKPQGDAGLYGASFELLNNSAHHVLVDGVWYAPGQQIFSLSNKVHTGSDGLWTSESLKLLPYGSYKVREAWAPYGYQLSGTLEANAVVRGDGVINDNDTVASSIKNDVIRGGVTVVKFDAETGQAYPQGEGMLDATFAIVNISDNDVYVNGKVYSYGQVVATIEADGMTGVAATAADLLPYGTYEIYEQSPATGYVLDEDAPVLTFRIRTNGEVVSTSRDGKDLRFGNRIIRSGIAIDKSLVYGPASDLAGIGFAVFDKDGNRMSWKDENGKTVDVIVLGHDGKGSTPSDAFVYGHYTVEELLDTVPSYLFSYAQMSGDGSNQVGRLFASDDGAMYSIAVVNYAKPEIDIIKIDGDSLQQDGSRELVKLPSTWVLEKHEGGTWTTLQAVKTTGGKASFDRTLLGLGTFRLREVASPGQDSNDGWMMPEAAGQNSCFEFVIDADTYAKFANAKVEGSLAKDGHEIAYGKSAEGRALITATAVNWRYRQIVTHKVDAETGEGVANTVFALEKLVDGDWIEVGRLDTDDKGDCIFNGLEFGTYRLTELYPNPGYMGPEEGGTLGQFIIEVNAPNGQSQIQVVDDKPIHVEATVDKSTVDKTTVGLVYKDRFGNVINNVGNESYKYEVGFSNGKTNVFADEYWVVDNLEMVNDPYNLVVNTLITPTVANDSDGFFWLLFKTALGTSGTDASTMKFTQPELHAGQTLCDGTQRFDATGWRCFGKYSTSIAEKLVLSDLLEKDDYVTAIALCYGAVEPGFKTLSNLVYYVMATHELSDDMVIPNSVTSHISRNWSSVCHTAEGDKPQAPDGLRDDARDVVKTVLEKPEEPVIIGAGRAAVAKTGDALSLVMATLALLVAISAACLVLCRLRKEC